MAKYRVTNTSNIRKFTYGHQLEPGESKEVDLLVKEAEKIPSDSFHVERLDDPADEPSEEPERAESQNQNEQDSGGETE